MPIETEQETCDTAQLVEPAGGPIWLELTGPPGTREFLTGVR